jgi:uncharacterized protein (DUF302 family)
MVRNDISRLLRNGSARNMSRRQIVGIGNSDAQQRFMRENKRFLEEWPLLQAVIEKVPFVGGGRDSLGRVLDGLR